MKEGGRMEWNSVHFVCNWNGKRSGRTYATAKRSNKVLERTTIRCVRRVRPRLKKTEGHE